MSLKNYASLSHPMSHRLPYIPLRLLGLSTAFNDACIEMDIHTIADITRLTPAELIRREGFSLAWLSELVEYLKEIDALELIHPLPGNLKLT